MPDDLVVDFVFVPNGAPFPHDWVRRHPDYISLPARFKGTPAQFRRFMGRRAVPGRTDVEGRTNVSALAPSVAAPVPGNYPPNLAQPASFGTEVDAHTRRSWDVADLGFGLGTEKYGSGVRYAMDLPRSPSGTATDARLIGTGAFPPVTPSRGDRHDADIPPTPQPAGRLSYEQMVALVRANNLAPVDDEVLIAIAYIESRFNADEKTPGPTATPIGLMQVSDSAVKQLLQSYPKAVSAGLSRTKSADAVQLASLYLRWAIEHKGGLNGGLFQYGDRTGTYVPRVLAAAAALKKHPADPMAALRQTIGK